MLGTIGAKNQINDFKFSQEATYEKCHIIFVKDQISRLSTSIQMLKMHVYS